MKLAPAWLTGYRRAWLAPDVIAGVIVWSVVVPQAVAYAQIAELPPETGLMAAPGAMIAYAFLGSSRTLIVSATTATSALSASAVGLLAHGDTLRFATLSTALALVTAVVLVAGGVIGLGALSDFVSKPVMGGFLFGLGLTIIVGQGAEAARRARRQRRVLRPARRPRRPRRRDQLVDRRRRRSERLALVAFRRLAPRLPGTLIVLAAAIILAAVLGLEDRGVDLVGKLPRGFPTRRCRMCRSTICSRCSPRRSACSC